MNASIISFESDYQAQVISTQYLRDEHSLVDNSILIGNLGIAAVKLAASLESFAVKFLPTSSDLACFLDSLQSQRNSFLARCECCDEDTPKIYVSCLSAYNSGRLWGMWIDATQDVEDIYTDIKEMLSLSPVAHIEPCEEWRIDDYECFEGVTVREYESIDRVSQIATAVEENGKAFALYLDYMGEDDIDKAVEQFQDRYRGCYESAEDYARDYYESTGMLERIEAAGLESFYIDFKKIAHNCRATPLRFPQLGNAPDP